MFPVVNRLSAVSYKTWFIFHGNTSLKEAYNALFLVPLPSKCNNVAPCLGYAVEESPLPTVSKFISAIDVLGTFRF